MSKLQVTVSIAHGDGASARRSLHASDCLLGSGDRERDPCKIALSAPDHIERAIQVEIDVEDRIARRWDCQRARLHFVALVRRAPPRTRRLTGCEDIRSRVAVEIRDERPPRKLHRSTEDARRHILELAPAQTRREHGVPRSTEEIVDVLVGVVVLGQRPGECALHREAAPRRRIDEAAFEREVGLTFRLSVRSIAPQHPHAELTADEQVEVAVVVEIRGEQLGRRTWKRRDLEAARLEEHAQLGVGIGVVAGLQHRELRAPRHDDVEVVVVPHVEGFEGIRALG